MISFKSNYKKFCCLAVLLLLAFILLLTLFYPCLAFAVENEENNFDNINVLEDLQSSTANGKPFDLTDYPFNESGDIGLITFIEYCYSYKANLQNNYGMYVYLYNPSGKEIDISSKSNKIQMAVSYDSDKIPNDYEKFDLKFLSKSIGNYMNLFYKFKVVDHTSADGKTILQRVNSNERKYDISGIEIVHKGDMNAEEYGVGGTYKFSGYSKGYGADKDAESNLTCSITELETIELEVEDTRYRTESSSAGKNHKNQLESVYFAIDNEILNKYGRLQKVKAEWYEYKTKEVVVTSNQEFYNNAIGYVGKTMSSSFNEDIGQALFADYFDGAGMTSASWGWNGGSFALHPPCSTIYYLLKQNNIEADITSKRLKDYIENYSGSSSNSLPIKNGSVSADLFMDIVDSGRTKGYNCVNIDSSETVDLLSYNSSHNAWDKLCDYSLLDILFNKVPSDNSLYGVKPIEEVKSLSSYSDIESDLLIDSVDIDNFKSYCDNATNQNKTTFLFRFALTDYYSVPLSLLTPRGVLLGNKIEDGQAYFAQETVFFDFDILQLTFNKDGVYKVIPVVSNPIDIVGGIIAPDFPDGFDWLKLIAIILGIILVLMVLGPILPCIVRFVLLILKGVWWLVSLPFRAIIKACKKKK